MSTQYQLQNPDTADQLSIIEQKKIKYQRNLKNQTIPFIQENKEKQRNFIPLSKYNEFSLGKVHLSQKSHNKNNQKIFNLNTQEYINPLYQPQKYIHTIFDPKLKDRKSQSVSKIVTAGQPQLQDFKFKYSEAQLENFYAHKKNKQDNMIGKFQDDQYLKKQNENLDYTQKIQKQYKLPDYPDQGYIYKAIKNQYQDEQKEYQNQQKRQLGKLLVWTNNNSLLQTHVSKTMTLGRNTKDYINWTKYKDNNFYTQKYYNDKLEKLEPKVKILVENGEKIFTVNENFQQSGYIYKNKSVNQLIPGQQNQNIPQSEVQKKYGSKQIQLGNKNNEVQAGNSYIKLNDGNGMNKNIRNLNGIKNKANRINKENSLSKVIKQNNIKSKKQLQESSQNNLI